MNNLLNSILSLLFVLLLSSSLSADSTNIHFAVARIDYQTYDIKGYYEFSQLYVPTDIVDPKYTFTGSLYYYHQPAVDFGFTSMISALTGDTIYHATSTWMGLGGEVLFPNDSQYKTNYTIGHISSPPDLRSYISFYGSEEAKADTAWSVIKETDFIHRLDSIDRYEVLVFDQAFILGVVDTTDNEWVILAYTNPVTTGIEGSTELPDDYFLSLNYPNPFNPSTTIEYVLPHSGVVSLIVYNLRGEEVIRLVDSFQQAGEYTSNWNASNVSSGIYFYRLRSGDFVQTKKMVLLR